jgi:hypothetical protein
MSGGDGIMETGWAPKMRTKVAEALAGTPVIATLWKRVRKYWARAPVLVCVIYGTWLLLWLAAGVAVGLFHMMEGTV